MKHAPHRILLSLLLLAAGAITPLWAQQVATVKPIMAPRVNELQVDWKAEFEKERARNQQLRAENEALKAQLAEWTRKGGSLVHAYCETPTVSANSAGARNDCAVSGYGCEPVSGLCRTVARSSNDCAPGFLMDVDRCVPRP